MMPLETDQTVQGGFELEATLNQASSACAGVRSKAMPLPGSAYWFKLLKFWTRIWTSARSLGIASVAVPESVARLISRPTAVGIVKNTDGTPFVYVKVIELTGAV